MRFALLILLSLTPSLIAAQALPPDNRATVEALRQVTDILESGKIDADDRTELWCKVAELRCRIGDRRGAMDAIRRACAANEMVIEIRKVNWAPIIITCARMGEAEKTRELAGHISEDIEGKDTKPRCNMLSAAAGEAARAGHFNAAGEIADDITEEGIWKEAREYVRRLEVVAQFKSGDTEAALRAVTTLPAAIQKIHALVGEPMTELRDDISEPGNGIADLQLLAKDKAGARQSALAARDLIRDLEPRDRNAGALAVIRILCLLDDVTEARKVLARHLAAVPNMTRAHAASELLARGHIATAEIRAGRDEAALAFLKDFDRKVDQVRLLHMIALAQARAGRREASTASFAKAITCAAEHAAENTKTGRDRIREVFCAQALAGDIFGAIAAARYFQCDDLLGMVILIQAKTGDFDGARMTFANLLPARDWVEHFLLPQIARMQAAAGQPEAVRKWAEDLESHLNRVAVLLALAEGLCQSRGKPGGK